MTALPGVYNIWIVALSFLIAYFTSYQALGLSKKVTASPGQISWGWLFVAGFVMGCGIWTMHFVGMIAFHLPIGVEYDWFKSLLSIIASILASLLAFYVSAKEGSGLNIFLSSLLMASGIVTMHYMGMSSMKSDFMTISYRPSLLFVSVLIAIIASFAAMQLFIRIKQRSNNVLLKLIAALLMAIAVSGMHYVGMEASQFWCIDPSYLENGLNSPIPTALLLTTSIVIVVLVVLTGLAQIWEQRMFRKMAYTDSLTGLSNRHAMNNFFRHARLSNKPIAILFIDLDQFKYINDTLGHDVGDILIQQMGQRLKKHAAVKENVFRIGGDEFMIVLPYKEKAEVISFIELLLDEIRKPFNVGDLQFEVTGSIGVSYSGEHGDDKDRLLKAADTAMYYAKSSGKNQYCQYDMEMEKALIRRMEIEKGMREALVKHTFEIYYQPKWDIERNKPIGFEALLRFRHPQLGFISPHEFIPIAEDTGLIIAMSEWVLGKACKDCVSWNETYNEAYIVSINLSTKLIESNRLVMMTEKALSISGLSPKLLDFEVTEHTIMVCGNELNKQTLPLRQQGVSLSMDNFGSGFTFLGSLDQMLFRSIKIDRDYIENYEEPTKRAIVNTMIELANQLNIQLIAEGVETEKQLQSLKEAGCSVMQGYYVKKPMPLVELNVWLKELES